MSDLALPPHLRGRKHNDWPWPFKNVSRGWNAKGPRCRSNPATSTSDPASYLAWPPWIVEGYGVSRWESAGGESIIHIPALDDFHITKGSDVYNRQWMAVEMNPGHVDFLKVKDIFLPRWKESSVYDVLRPNGLYEQHCEPDQYSPSALQKFSPKGWMKLEPFYYAQWHLLKKRELPIFPETGEDQVIFFRRGNRPDHVDLYYNCDRLVPFGFAGLKWE